MSGLKDLIRINWDTKSIRIKIYQVLKTQQANIEHISMIIVMFFINWHDYQVEDMYISPNLKTGADVHSTLKFLNGKEGLECPKFI